MRVVAVRQMTGSYGTVNAGQEFDVSDNLASKLISRGLARKMMPRVQHKAFLEMDNKAAAAPLAGSPDGTVASSSGEVQARAKRTYRKRGESSPS